ncbi:DNA polymerase III subunit delta [Caloramator sp. ALD01]|uniref:DNA polymerase III subunit delta n=1 Tax=Caloramator sp. ALD01 TaxID=1031288 RepID=UPI0004100404|nr:DNA polymerase III subunit delta [Caloramator sp. ALD01]
MELNNFSDFKKNIKNIKSLILVYGQEKTIIDNTIELVYDLITQFKEINILIMDGENVSIESIINACETTPFMSDKRLIHIKNANYIFENNALSNELSKYLNNIPDTNILLLSSYSNVDKSGNLYKLFRTNGMVIEYKKLKGENLQEYIQNYLNKENKTITKSNLLYLTSELTLCNENIDLELKKLVDYLGDKKTVDKIDIDLILSKSIENNIFRLLDYITIKELDDAVMVYNQMILQGEEELMILSMIFRNYKIMYLLKIYGENYNDVVKKYNIRDFALKNYIKWIKKYELSDLKKNIKRCYEYDLKIKQGELNASIAVENLIIELCA